MTEKELKKLSRLELLELLLDESRENKKLRAELEKIKTENSIEKKRENLSVITKQLNTALSSVHTLTRDLQKIREDTASQPQRTENLATDEKKKQENTFDRSLYQRLMNFFYRNEIYTALLPKELQDDVKTRLRSILNERK